ncbi:hypothetical protein [Klebsiella aerogenes]|uniref:hypothetical protein n=1 Tax=Klebsiella aerogenes TaxID=548 RepID=UPI00140F9344|nr:hypothetical protein [Klebsiella aerogenes]QIP25451.1 hypothetical protein HA513_14435 [Klebsiella aerogenes]
MIYALIKDAIVQNVVVCDDDDSAKLLFSKFTVINIDDMNVGIGWGYDGESFIEPPTPEPSPDDIASGRLVFAQSEYDKATDKINYLNEQVADTDYSGTTEADVMTLLERWTDYRKKLRAYIMTQDGSEPLPASPTV